MTSNCGCPVRPWQLLPSVQAAAGLRHRVTSWCRIRQCSASTALWMLYATYLPEGVRIFVHPTRRQCAEPDLEPPSALGRSGYRPFCLQLPKRGLHGRAINRLSLFPAISLIQLRQIAGNPLIKHRLLVPELFRRHLFTVRSHCLKFAAINGHQLTGNQTCVATKPNKGTAGRGERSTVVTPKISNGFEIGASRPNNHMTSTLRWHSASSRREERMRWK